MNKLINTRLSFFLLLIIVCIPASLPLILPGFYEPHDLHHFADIYQMVRAIGSGQIPPRLGPDFSFGYGYPLFNFYYLTPFYLGAFFFFIVNSITLSFKLVFITSIIISVFGMYLFLKEFLGKWAALSGSVLFLYTPYRAVQIYVRGAMGEAFALSLIPLVLLGVVKIIKKPKDTKMIVATSIIFSIFILSHNYLWAMTLPLLVSLVFLLIYRKKYWNAILSLLKTGILSLGMTAFWWLPALIEQRLVGNKTPFPLIDHFPFIKQLIMPGWGYGSSVWGGSDEISFQIGILNLIVTATLILILVFKRKLLKGKILIISLWAVFGFLVSVVFMNIRTYPLWKLIPFHDFIQFPWRLLIYTTIFSSILVAVLISLFGKRKQKWFTLVVIFFSILITFNYFKPSQIFYKNDSDYFKRFFADQLSGQVSEEYLLYSEDYLLLPNWVDERPKSIPKQKIESDDAKVTNIKRNSLVNYSADVESDKHATITFNSYYFPGWNAYLDGKLVDVSAGKPHGQMEVNVAQGNYKIEFAWKETGLRKLSDLTSLVSFIFALFLLIYPKWKRGFN